MANSVPPLVTGPKICEYQRQGAVVIDQHGAQIGHWTARTVEHGATAAADRLDDGADPGGFQRAAENVRAIEVDMRARARCDDQPARSVDDCAAGEISGAASRRRNGLGIGKVVEEDDFAAAARVHRAGIGAAAGDAEDAPRSRSHRTDVDHQ
jgi:hypothetical protein